MENKGKNKLYIGEEWITRKSVPDPDIYGLLVAHHYSKKERGTLRYLVQGTSSKKPIYFLLQPISLRHNRG